MTNSGTISANLENIPKGWDEINLGQYVFRVKTIQNPDLSEIEKWITVVSNFTGITISDLRAPGNLDDVIGLSHSMRWAFETEPESGPISQFELNGEVYFIPENLGEQSFGEYVDFDSLIKAAGDNLISSLNKILAILCRPAGEEVYTDEVSKRALARSDEFNQLPCTIAMGVAAFFLNKRKQSKNVLLAYTNEVAEIAERMQRLSSNTAGWRPLYHWLKRTTLRSIRSQLNQPPTES